MSAFALAERAPDARKGLPAFHEELAKARAPATDSAPGKLRVAVLVSGRGSNLQALIDARAASLAIDLVGVFCDRSKAAALQIARSARLVAQCIRPAAFPDEAAYQRELFEAVARTLPDIIVCAGFMRIIQPEALATSAPMINIHPSLLPKHRGLDTHRRALAAGDAVHGASVHRVTAELDGGPLIAQVQVPIRSDDDVQTLATRVLMEEHRLLVACVAALASSEIELDVTGDIRHNGEPLSCALLLDEAGKLQAA